MADCHIVECHPVLLIVVFIFAIVVIAVLLHCYHHYHPVTLSGLPLIAIAIVQRFKA
jgi:hypothetical protein